VRRELKAALGSARSRRAARGLVILTYHRVGGCSVDERDMSIQDFERQLEMLATHDVVALDASLDALDGHDAAPRVVITFDDGFRDMYDHAWPLLRHHRLPFTLYLATSYVGTNMDWPGSTARAPGRGMTWSMVEELVESGLCTVANHTHRHVPASDLTVGELDQCTEAIQRHLGVTPRHFAYPWGVPVPAMESALAQRFRSAASGLVGRNLPGVDPIRLARVPVRRTDPLAFFAAKLTGRLVPEHAYAMTVRVAKSAGIRG
jgi:hypothetical protein